MDKFLSSQLNISRTDAKKLLRQGGVLVNSIIAKKADAAINPQTDKVSVNGNVIEYKKHIYIMLNKPKGIVSATTDGRDKTVIDILPDKLKRSGLFPAGRLDKDTTGFTLITDDGEFAHNILSPSHHVKKTYIVEVGRKVTEDEMKRFIDGMMIGDELFKPAQLRFMSENADTGNFQYEIKIIEGRYHQIKRMFASVSNPVLELTRTAIGGLELDTGLNPGEAREITKKELDKITEKKNIN